MSGNESDDFAMLDSHKDDAERKRVLRIDFSCEITADAAAPILIGLPHGGTDCGHSGDVSRFGEADEDGHRKFLKGSPAWAV
jgi:hypothetical protein